MLTIPSARESLTSVNLAMSLESMAGLTSFSANLIKAFMRVPYLVFLRVAWTLLKAFLALVT